MATYTPKINYKVCGTNPPFTVQLSGTSGIVCQQIIGATGLTTSMSLSCADYNKPFNISIVNTCGTRCSTNFTLIKEPSALSVTNATKTSGVNYCCYTGNINITPTLPASYTGTTTLCLCNVNSVYFPGLIYGYTRTRIYCNGTLTCTNSAISTGVAVNASKTIDINIKNSDTLSYDLYSCIGSSTTIQSTCVCLSNVSCVPIECNYKANIAIDTNNKSDGFSISNYTKPTKTISSVRSTLTYPAYCSINATGLMSISSALSVGECMRVCIDGSTAVLGGSSSIAYYKSTCGGSYTPVCSVSNATSSPHAIELLFENGDIYCYSLNVSAAVPATIATSCFTITSVVSSSSEIYCAAICASAKSDIITVSSAATTIAPTTIPTTTTTTTTAAP